MKGWKIQLTLVLLLVVTFCVIFTLHMVLKKENFNISDRIVERIFYGYPRNDTKGNLPTTVSTLPNYLIPEDDELAKLDLPAMIHIYWKYINRLQTLCKDIVRVGSLKDGGKEICVDEPYGLKAPCLVYSFGINFQYDFDNAVVDMFGCDVYCFDPSMANGSHRVSQKIWFYNWGLGGTNFVNAKGWNIKTLDMIRKELGHQNQTIDLLKIDIEGSEWSSIPQMISSGALNDIKQISMETHFTEEHLHHRDYWGNVEPQKQLSALRQLYEFGYRIFMRERNMWSHQMWPGVKGFSTMVNEISVIKIEK